MIGKLVSEQEKGTIAMKTVIHLQQVQKKFGKQVAVAIEDLRIKEGEIYGLIGPNGAGKSTLMKMICGLLTPDKGQIRLNGHNLSESAPSLLRQLGCLIEEPAYYDNLTGHENLTILQTLKGLTETDVAEALAIVRLTDHKDKLVKHYSLGMKQRLGIAMAIMGRPRFVILDEPTNGLDPQAREEIRQLIRSLPERFQTTVMVSSHALDEIEKMVTQIGIIGRGKLLYQGTIDQFKHRHASQLFVRTSDDALAREVLAPLSIEMVDKGLLLPYASDEEVVEWVHRLARAGVSVYRISDRSKSLEELFIAFTESSQL